MVKNILIIDDNEDILGIFEQVLVDEGFDVSTANNGNEGIKLFKRQSFDIVIIDINMPGMNGFEVVENIKNDFILVPIILMSSDYLPIDAAEIENLGVNAVISKTIDDTTFCNLVRSCLLEDKIYTSKIF
jgi:CheY-like chemotaxis protein